MDQLVKIIVTLSEVVNALSGSINDNEREKIKKIVKMPNKLARKANGINRERYLDVDGQRNSRRWAEIERR